MIESKKGRNADRLNAPSKVPFVNSTESVYEAYPVHTKLHIFLIEGKKDPGVPNFGNFKQKKQNKEEQQKKRVSSVPRKKFMHEKIKGTESTLFRLLVIKNVKI